MIWKAQRVSRFVATRYMQRQLECPDWDVCYQGTFRGHPAVLSSYELAYGPRTTSCEVAIFAGFCILTQRLVYTHARNPVGIKHQLRHCRPAKDLRAACKCISFGQWLQLSPVVASGNSLTLRYHQQQKKRSTFEIPVVILEVYRKLSESLRGLIRPS